MSTVVFRNSQEAFIHKHISKILTDKGHDVLDISRAADFAVETYRNTASFGGAKGGKCFEFCLAKAEQLLAPVKKQAAKNKRKAKAA
ncbi:hypothetical protein [Vibrio fluvialis]|uniref:hypothetical protein n=1 Tax=Vibrio fluvialis TaxID=676 RepID=UPI00192CDE3B|nr:hypothetical protein [Vibrio fluvialis]MBL4265726.1 hypothetical protein [Vibrio fluvialis]MBL4270114.1 hypothetical protein [Vibrio fluvialis]MCE7625549.1 hypothetical protein [Vibrio fluvialis]MCG6363845.1 hypothetical protein [Vibrio fluvialis]